jgi:hypothetical protein
MLRARCLQKEDIDMPNLSSTSLRAVLAGAAALSLSAMATPASAGWGGGFQHGAFHGGGIRPAGWHGGWGAWHGGWHGGYGWHAGYGWRPGWGWSARYPVYNFGWAGYSYAAAPYYVAPAVAVRIASPAYVVHHTYYRHVVHARCGCR